MSTMTNQTTRTVADITNAAKATIDTFIALQESNRGTEMAAILTDDAVLDLNVPLWRFQVGGSDAFAGTFAESFPAGFRTRQFQWVPTPVGAVVEYDGRDTATGNYFRHLAVFELRDGLVSRLTIYCTGPWDQETLDRQRREAPMVDAEPTGGAR